MQKLKWMWLAAGVICGTIFSASSEERKIQSVSLKVAAVSVEDAQERAQDSLSEDGHPSLEKLKVLAILQPQCESGADGHSFYRCQARVLLQ